MGGVPGINHDPCYHQACDSIQNINVFGYEKMVQAAAYALEFLGQEEDLKGWLYPSTQTQQLTARLLYEELPLPYKSSNKHFPSVHI